MICKFDPTTGRKYYGAEKPDLYYLHEQLIPSATWDITHNLGKHPSVSIVDTANETVMGDIEYISLYELRISFSAAFAGSAYLN